MNWYKFNVSDYLLETKHLEGADDLAYRRMLDMYYLTEKPLPLDVEYIARKIKIDLDVVAYVLEEFFLRSEGGYLHNHCEKDLSQRRKVRELNSRPKKKVAKLKVIE
jgi:uncharacterized protein YdaU (DUF1376 family)